MHDDSDRPVRTKIAASLRAAVGVICAGALLAACGGSVSFSLGGQSAPEAAVELIESDEMALRIGLDDITDAACDEPDDDSVGTVFMCTALSGGRTVEFDVEIDAEDHIFAGPTNVVDRTLVGDYAASAVASLNATNDLSLPEDAIDCGQDSIVLDANDTMICALTDPESGIVYDAAITVSDTQVGSFAVEVVGESAG